LKYHPESSHRAAKSYTEELASFSYLLALYAELAACGMLLVKVPLAVA
jgi:hypothetical protein